ncbi:HAMP domain-containing histidine kinase [Granulicatella adiacens ATCC 49175]|uniref:Signal transduction histidine-protein kinase ArlS n=2 Tax=Granulicatella TaxID=117563 RepID=C8NFY6_9LACT|nr:MULTISPECIES: ATP-binding protein [Granulicatella]EEW37472.1 ATPase/histidine kinase/DNA gyrase B/HSP90 domain protein [Granulicatella adiacens ATCC 49175]OFT01092.1 histidine kinase [Granulicatella sp. HMSC31F03]UWP37678.1 HAMP domain-containing histidine kinase [Granulicatella adiacens ATCC 49175]
MMNSNSQHKSVAKKWWWVISATIFALLGILTTILIHGQIMTLRENEKNQTIVYAQVVSDLLSRKSENLTAADIVSILNEAEQYEQGQNGIYKKNSSFYPMNEELNIRVFDTSRELIFQTQQWQDPLQVSSTLETKFVPLSTGEESIQVTMPILSRTNRLLIGHLQIINRMAKLTEMKKQLQKLYIQLLIMEALVSIGLAYFISRLISKPIEQIHDIIASINEDNIDSKRLIIPKKNDEFAVVSQQFNELLDKISFYISQQKHFVEDVSHELRTPVAIVEGHLKLLNRWGKDDPEVLEESLEASLAEIKRMKTLVQEMLDLSRAPQVREQYKDATTEVVDTLTQIVANFKVLYPDFTFVLDIDSKADLLSPIYRNHFEQVIIILLDNAVKYSTNRKEIIVSLSTVADQVEIGIQDFGMGLSEEDKKKVFSRFYRVDKARSRERGGNGLGLSIAKELIEGYNGSISLTSHLDQGTVFKVKLPIVSS